jgi:hypothetical protein
MVDKAAIDRNLDIAVAPMGFEVRRKAGYRFALADTMYTRSGRLFIFSEFRRE